MTTRHITVAAAVTAVCALIATSLAARPPATTERPVRVDPAPTTLDRDAYPPGTSVGALRSATAPAETTVLGSWTFDNNGCDRQGWTSTDITAQIGVFFHVDDFAGLGGGDFGRLHALQGAQSMWCGARPDGADQVLCTYATLPGYGNNWDQVLETQCLDVTGDVSVDYLITWDSEPWYDATEVDYLDCDNSAQGWIRVDGGVDVLDGVGVDSLWATAIPDSFYYGLRGDRIRIRFRFTSDGAWSDQDGLHDTDGAVILDSLSVHDAVGTVLPVETFEAEAVGDTATVSGAWTATVPPGYGDYAGLFQGAGVVQEDPCARDLTCLWAFFKGSTYTYACGGFPSQKAVPYQNARSQYIDNEIWSPAVPLSGTGSDFVFETDIYRDLSLSDEIFYVWHVRSRVDGCWARWRQRTSVYYGSQKDWYRFTVPFGDLVDPGATDVQVALGVVDMCRVWYCFGEECHSHAPLFDNIRVVRIDHTGPQWSVRDIDFFQDNFAHDGTLTGTVRADAAIDRAPSDSPTIYPGDSSVVSVADVEAPLAGDTYTGTGPAVYAYVSVLPQGQAGKDGPALSGDAARWPVVDSLASSGVTWYTLRMDTVFTNGGIAADRYCVDLNDNLFTPGDTIQFAFGARNTLGEWSYYTRARGTVGTRAEALAQPMEFTCLPAGGYRRGGDILYVDGMDGRGTEPFFDTSFNSLNLLDLVDRYDVRGPSSGVSNRPGSRVVDVYQQIIPVYRRIVWNTGDLGVTLGPDSPGSGDKSDDWGMLATWLANVDTTGVLYLNGDDIAEHLVDQTSAGANLFKTFLGYSLVSGNATAKGFGIAPLGVGEDGGIFDHVLGPDTLVVYGGCPDVNDFDVLSPQGSASAQMSYGGPYSAGAPNGAVLVQTTTNSAGHDVTVVLSGFGFESIRDERPLGFAERTHHLWDILRQAGFFPWPDAVGPSPLTSSLGRSYPNPFNPQTMIPFTLAERGRVTVRVYDVAGRLVRTLVDDVRAPGVRHRVTWDGRNNAGQRVASGVYFCRMVTKGFVQTRKMVLLK